MMNRTARSFFKGDRKTTIRQEAERQGRDVSALDDPPAGTIEAYVNHGRWIAECPACNGAEFVEPREVMTCSNCLASYVVDFPPQYQAIDTLLGKRPDETTRNWRAGETVADIARENRDHGIEE